MVIWSPRLKGRPVAVHAPAKGAPFLPPQGRDLLWGLDVETTAIGPRNVWDSDWRLRTVQLAGSDDAVWVLRMDDPEQEKAARAILEDPDLLFATHSQYDVLAVHRWLGIDLSGRFVDTHVLSVMASPGTLRGQADLKPVASRFHMPELAEAEAALEDHFRDMYRRDVQPKGRARGALVTAHGFSHVDLGERTFTVYGGLDALVTRRLVPELVKASKAPPRLITQERWLSRQAVRLRMRGHRVDLERLAYVEGQARDDQARATRVVQEVTDGRLLPSQGRALVEWFGEHGVDWSTVPRTPKGAPSLAKDAPLAILRQDLGPEVRDVAEAYLRWSRVVDKQKRTKEIREAMDERGHVHPTLVTVGTVTGRMSSSSPNMQNFSKTDPEMRGLFLPEEGHVLISCDFAQIELRVLAALAGESRMIEVIKEGGDLHSLTAQLLGIDRQTAKTVNFLIVYGGGGGRLAAQLGYSITTDEARKVVQDYWRQYPAIAGLNDVMRRCPDVMLITGRVVPSGADRSYANLNYLIQGSARELLVACWRRFARTRDRADMAWFPIHDELVLQVPEDRAQEISAEISAAMTLDFYGVPVQAEADVLLDQDGVSRWMSGDTARKIAEAQHV